MDQRQGRGTMTDFDDFLDESDRIAENARLAAETTVALGHGERIAELEQQLHDLRACHDEHYAGMLAAMAENERLRALVTEITMQYDSMPHSVDPMPNLDISIDQRVGALVTVYMVQCHRLAQIRAALGEGG